MVFIKKVESGSKTYYYLVQSYRIGKNVSQKTIKRLTAEEANDPNYIMNFLRDNPEFQMKSIKAIIPAAGKSVRLFPYSEDLPKGLIPVGDKTLLQHTIDCLHSCGITDITLILGFQDEKVRVNLSNEVKFVYNPFYRVSNILASIWFALSEMDGTLIVLYSDLLFPKQIIHDLLQDENDICVAISHSKIDDEVEKVLIDNGYLLEIGKDIPYGPEVFEFTGIAKFSEKGTNELRETIIELSREEEFLNLYFTDVFERLILKGNKIVTKMISPDHWIDIDFPKDLQRAENVILPNLLKNER